MTKLQHSTPSRRTVLSGIGTGLAASLLGTEAMATESESQYVLVQNDACVPVQPIRGDAPADAFYEYQLPEKYVTDANGAVAGDAAPYASAGTQDLQRAQTSVAFLYQGPEGLSLVVVHGSVENADAGSVTFEIAGLPEDGEWIVRDDFYRNPDTGERASTNYDRWDVEGTDHRIDWTWGSSGTDGGVFRDLGDDFDVAVRPAFNEAASLYNEYYEGTVTDWEFLSEAADDVERVSMDPKEPIRIRTGSCEDATTPTRTDQQTEHSKTATERETKTEQERETEMETTQETDQQVDQEQDIDVEQEQEVEGGQEVETEQTQEVKTEQRQEGKTEEEQQTATEKEEEAEEDEEEAEEKEKANEEAERAKEEGKEKEKGGGKGHEKGRGKGHGKHDEDEDDEDEDDEDEDDEGEDE